MSRDHLFAQQARAKELQEHGFSYYSIGKKPVKPLTI